MLRIFRSIRRRLLSGNRISRYLIYALGEIVLVVIGILLALQFNGWNENRKEKVQVGINLRALRADLVRDTALIHKTLEVGRQDSTLLGRFRDTLSAPDVTREAIVRMARYEFTPWIFMEVAFNNNTYRSLEATGEIKALPDSLKDSLMSLNNDQQRYMGTSESDVAIYLDNTINYGSRYPFTDVGHLDPDSKLAGRIWSETKLEELGAAFNALVGVKYSCYYAHLPALEEILGRTERLLGAIDQHLSQMETR